MSLADCKPSQLAQLLDHPYAGDPGFYGLNLVKGKILRNSICCRFLSYRSLDEIRSISFTKSSLLFVY